MKCCDREGVEFSDAAAKYVPPENPRRHLDHSLQFWRERPARNLKDS